MEWNKTCGRQQTPTTTINEINDNKKKSIILNYVHVEYMPYIFVRVLVNVNTPLNGIISFE